MLIVLKCIYSFIKLQFLIMVLGQLKGKKELAVLLP